jgi:hypothetical protein
LVGRSVNVGQVPAVSKLSLGGNIGQVSSIVNSINSKCSEENIVELNRVSADDDTVKLKKAGFGKVIIDSGAGESVMPWQMLPQEPLVASSKANSRYRDASGHEMSNKGQKEVKMKINGKLASMVFQATDVRKPLAAVSRIVEKGNTVIFDADCSYILHKASGTKTPISLENGAYVINVEYLIPSSSAVDTASLRGPGFPRPA